MSITIPENTKLIAEMIAKYNLKELSFQLKATLKQCDMVLEYLNKYLTAMGKCIDYQSFSPVTINYENVKSQGATYSPSKKRIRIRLEYSISVMHEYMHHIYNDLKQNEIHIPEINELAKAIRKTTTHKNLANSTYTDSYKKYRNKTEEILCYFFEDYIRFKYLDMKPDKYTVREVKKYQDILEKIIDKAHKKKI